MIYNITVVLSLIKFYTLTMKKCNFWSNVFVTLCTGLIIILIFVYNKYDIYKQISEFQDVKSEFQTELFEELNVEINSPLADSIDYYDVKIDSLYRLL